jgi:PAS domain S-box-containing protein
MAGTARGGSPTADPARLDAAGLLRSLMQNVPGAIYRCSLDPDWTMQLIGEEIERIAGYPAADFIDSRLRTFGSIIHPDDRDEVDTRVRTAVEAGRSYSLEYRLVRPDGEIRWVLERGSPAVDPEGVEWLDGVIFDVTERRANEEQAREREVEAARVTELEASRARIVQASDEARRRLERDLHDGAQQRLVAASLALKLAQRRAGDEQPALAALLGQAEAELTAGLAELRELARGIHPAVLTDHGLPAAVQALAARCSVPIEVEIALSRRFPAAVESALYFSAAEALTNVAKYAGAASATIALGERGDRVWLEVGDDGCGGAAPDGGSGLQGIADRVGAVGGRLTLASPAGGGTVVRIEVPADGLPARR